MGPIVHDLRRTCAYESWKAGSSPEDCSKLTGHKSLSMFKRYGDLFGADEERARQLEVQQRRRQWRESNQQIVVGVTAN